MGEFKNLIENLIWQWVREWQQFPEVVGQPEAPELSSSPHLVIWQALETSGVLSLAVIN